MTQIPSLLLQRLYTFNTLKNEAGSVRFLIKNRLSDGQMTALQGVRIDDQDIDLDVVTIELADGVTVAAKDVSPGDPIAFPLRAILMFRLRIDPLPKGKHKIQIACDTQPFGLLKFEVEDSISESGREMVRIPRDPVDNYSEEIITRRQQFISQYTGATVHHITKYSFDPHITQGNIENFTGVAQVPLGFAGPLRMIKPGPGVGADDLKRCNPVTHEQRIGK